MLRSIRQETEKKPTAKAAVLDASEIARMRVSAKIETANDVKQQTIMNKQQKDAAMEQSNARKTRMQAMDRERASKVPATDIE